MNLLLIIFLAYTLAYAALWHNKPAAVDRQNSSSSGKPPSSGDALKGSDGAVHRDG